MKIILSIKNYFGKNVAFVTNNFKIFLLEEILELTKTGQINNVYVVKTSTSSYLRSKKNVPKNLQLDKISAGSDDIVSFIDNKISESTPVLSAYLALRNKSILENDSPIIKPVENNLYASTAVVKEKLLSVKEIIDRIGVENFGVNTSVGLAQIKIDTANNIIKKKLYNPNPSDQKLPAKRINRKARTYLYNYLIQPKHNIFFEDEFYNLSKTWLR